ncbi:integrase, catalytic region, zinc finger, CCHC-type containing protein [Tanacetum coccineum]
MMGNRSKLKNFMEKFIGIVKFGNDHFGAIMGYGDYVIGDNVISRVYYVEGHGHNLFSGRAFCDSDLESIFMDVASSPFNHFKLRTINDLARKDLVRGLPRLKFEKDHLCPGSVTGEKCRKAVATACYTQNRSLIHTHHNKTPYELVYDKKPDLTFLRVFGALCYPTNDSEDLGKFQAKADIGIFMHPTMAPVRMSSGPEPIIMAPGQLKSGLAPTDKELEMLIQPMFDEYVEQSRVNELVPSATAVNAQVVPPGTPLSTTIAQDAPSTSASSSTSDMHHPVLHQGITEEPTLEDSLITHDALHPSFNPVNREPSLTQSSSGNVNSAEPNQVTQPPDHFRR